MKRLLVVATTPRTGGTLLRGDARATGAMGDPGEWFNMDPGRHFDRFTEKWGVPRDDLDAYVEAIRRNTASPNGVVAVKLYEYHLRQLVRRGLLPEGPGRLRALAERFGEADPAIVLLTRDNKLRQAVSLYRARRSGKWGSLGSAGRSVRYSRRRIRACLIELAERENRLHRELDASGFTAGLHLVYERMLGEREEALAGIAGLLGLPDPAGAIAGWDPAANRMERQADDLTEQWVDRFIGWG